MLICMNRISSLLSTAVAVTLAACGVAEPLEDRLVGILVLEDGAPVVDVPDTVRAGTPFEVSVITVGGACIRRDDTDVEVDGATATVTPWDRFAIPRPGFGCLPSTSTLDHTASVTFSSPGAATVVVRGREDGADEVLTFSYPVVVEP